jgi:hypothetical protein
VRLQKYTTNPANFQKKSVNILFIGLYAASREAQKMAAPKGRPEGGEENFAILALSGRWP